MDYRRPKRALTLVVAFVALQSGPGHAQSPTLCGQPFDSNLATMYKRIRQLPDATLSPSRSPDFDVISVQGQTLNFTKRSHPACPSIACRRVAQIDGQMRVETLLHCDAAKSACDRLAEDYRALDKQMMDAIKQQQKR